MPFQQGREKPWERSWVCLAEDCTSVWTVDLSRNQQAVPAVWKGCNVPSCIVVVLYVFIPCEGVSAHVYLGKEGSALLPPSGLCRVAELCVFLDYRQGWDTQHLTLPSLSHHRKARQWQFYLKVEQRVLLFFLETKHLDLS